MLSTPGSAKAQKPVRLITLDPGHFHAALVQKTMYADVAPTVQVYAPAGPDLQLHLDRINGYNNRKEAPTRWKEAVYTGPDFFEKALVEKKGNVVVLSGNNAKKTEYIFKALQGGFHVLADKPMAINSADFKLLKKAFAVAKRQKKLLYDIMTERYEITTMLQRELSLLPAIFGTLQKGTPENPAITKESVHHFYKYVSGKVLMRPSWFMDVRQQGEGIVDVTTHLVDLVQWECFPGKVIHYQTDIDLLSARRWPTQMTAAQFNTITGQDGFPAYLEKDKLNDTTLNVYSNGEINYRLKGVHAKVSVTWNYQAPAGGGDTHFSLMRGTRANLVIKQGAEQQYKPTLYIEPVEGANATAIEKAFESLAKKYPGVSLQKVSAGWEVMIPEKYKEGHEEHFARVMQNFLQHLKKGTLPAWEVPNMLAKYYLTTKALELARKSNP